jgi:Fur family ferric uptake transcriptional regulator
MERLQYQIATDHDFHMLQHKMEIYGICGDCIQVQEKKMPLTDARAGERVIIESFRSGMMAKSRILSMGLRPGDLVEIITRQSHGQMVISSGCKRFVLGHGLANKILVHHTDQTPDVSDAECVETDAG